MKIKQKYSLIFVLTGVLLIIFSYIIKLFFDNLDWGKRFRTNPFYESDLYFWLGIISMLLGIMYFAFNKINRIQLIDKFIVRHYWFSIFFIIALVFVPFLNKYFPSNKYGGTLVYMFFSSYTFASVLFFFASFVIFFMNIIKSTYAYFLIKSKWKNN